MNGSSPLMLLAFATGAVFSLPLLAFQEDKASHQPGSLRWYAAKAKADGKERRVLPAAQGLYAQVKSLDEALSVYHAVIVTPVASRTYVEDYRIATTYKLRVVERVSERPLPEGPAAHVPGEFHPLRDDEFVMHSPGGSALVDGVILTMSSPIGDLVPLRNYLMFVMFDPRGRVGTLQIGGIGVFEVKQGRLEALSSAESALGRDIAVLRSLTRFRAEVAARAPLRQP